MHPRTLRAASGIVVAVAAATIATPAHAELLYEFTFNATVTQKSGDNPDHPWGGVELGDPASFTYVIDVEQEDQAPGGLTGFYDLQSVVVSYGGIAVEPQFVSLFEVDLFIPGLGQGVSVTVRQLWSDDFNEGGGFDLIGPFGVLTDDSIPIDFDVLDFTTERAIGYGDGTIAFRAEIDSYSYQIVPAPGAALGLLLGACFRTGRRRRP